MGRSPCCSKEGLNRGAWTAMEDKILTDYIKVHGEGKWRNLPKRAGLKRCGKSCRLRWLNYLRPDIRRGNITADEEDLIIRLHQLLGNRWSLIAGRLPGRTDNEIKNYWNTNIGKKLHAGGGGSNSNCRPKEKPRPATDGRSGGGAPRPNAESRVIRTKATRCTRVFISPELQNPRWFVSDEASAGEISPFASAEPNASDFVIDFEMDEEFLSDLLNSDIAALLDFDGGRNGHADAITSSSSANSDQTLLFPNEMLCDSDLLSVTPLPGSGWDS